MGFKSGISANISNNIPFNINNTSIPTDDKLKVGRVTDIILNTDYPSIQNFGGDSAIGTIMFKPQNFNTPGVTLARPFFPNILILKFSISKWSFESKDFTCSINCSISLIINYCISKISF